MIILKKISCLYHYVNDIWSIERGSSYFYTKGNYTNSITITQAYVKYQHKFQNDIIVKFFIILWCIMTKKNVFHWYLKFYLVKYL